MDFKKPRVAIYYHVLDKTGRRNDGCPLFINYNMRKILDGNTRLEDSTGNVVHLWPGNRPEDYGKFDLNIWVDYGEDALGLPLDWYPPSPNCYWVSDAHINGAAYKYRMETAKKFDTVFVAQKEFIEQFAADGVQRERIHFMPHAFEPDCYRPYEIINKWDWCFIGHPNSPHRIDLLDRLCKEFPNWYVGWRNAAVPGYNSLDDIAYKLSQSKVGVNYSVNKDLNMRVFETMGTRTCLLTDYLDVFEDVGLKDGVNLVTFTNETEAVTKMKKILADDVRRRTIAETGYQHVLANHTYHHRALQMLETCLNYKPEGKGVLQPC
jgi:hypothetical protein